MDKVCFVDKEISSTQGGHSINDAYVEEEAKPTNEINAEDNITAQSLSTVDLVDRISVNRMIPIVGDYGCFQKIVNIMVCLMAIPTTLHITVNYFVGAEPTWKCAENSSLCPYNGTLSSDDNLRCSLPRTEWTYTVSRDYSVQTQFDLVCDNGWLISLSTSLFFVAFIIGAVFTGWVSDNYGRRFVVSISMGIVLSVTLVSVWMPNIYLFIVCQCIVGFFCPGTYPQMFILISDIVGEKHRAFAGMSIFLTEAFGCGILCIKAYFIRQWKYLLIACSAPYMLMLFFIYFVPESIHFLLLKGRTDEAMVTLHRMAYWNKKVIPSSITLSEPPREVKNTANLLDLFRTRKLALLTIVLCYCWYACGVAYVGLYLDAEDLTGDFYLDYLLMAISEILGILLIMSIVDRLGRKISVMGGMFVGAATCVSLAFIPNVGSFKTMRLVFGVLSKSTLTGGFIGLYTWTIELYPARIRGEGMGLMQAATGIGSVCSPWIVEELKDLHEGAPFAAIGVLSLLAFLVMLYLPETKGCQTSDTGEELKNSVASSHGDTPVKDSIV